MCQRTPLSSASFLLLMVVFRSIVVPIKAIIMNLLSVGAAGDVASFTPGL